MRAILGTTLLGTLLSAQAGEITLFEHQRLQGRSVTVQSAVVDLQSLRFANQASSAMVREGTWELCSETQFRGVCRTLNPGEYSQLNDLNDQVRSLREVGGSGGLGNEGRRNQPAELTIYEHGSFRGRSVTLTGPTISLESVGMNDSVSSLIAKGAIWELCVHANFTPPCRQFGPGDHVEVGEQFNDQFSSARPLTGTSNYPSAPATRPPLISSSGIGGGRGDRRIDVVLFDNEDFSGDARSLSQAVESLDLWQFNDRTSSIVVIRGQWEFCSEAGFRGSCRTLGPGDHASLEGGLNNRVSSARPVGSAAGNTGPGNLGSGSGNPAWGSGGNWAGRTARGGSATLYEYGEFIGRSYTATQNIISLDEVGFNDRASSVIVDRGTWEFCTDAQYRGTCRTVGPGRYASIPYEMDGKISSLRQVGP